ncbi:hypothetical protein HYALB_00001947 [Hymenoscyphus albidus]|uniref:AB hydrolase-1 domain-containing protein n=1 Tax=Hymenoscyphus albidus TaxID=595503 RepID=A0A9N9Q381_9HELO|nr:hypothetical protein HYALB_00001947 [Hymenoscyphus albidus]
MRFISKLTTLVAFGTVSTATAIQKRGPTCSNVSFNVNINVLNFNLTGLDPNNLLGTFGSLPNPTLGVAVSSNFHIAGRFCEPEVVNPSRQNTLQFLVHGATYTRDYWTGKGFNGDQYSWVDYASKQGYPTLAIDRLGNGASDHPDPILVVQYPAQTEVLHKVLQAIRSGAGNSLPRQFSKIIYVGHSYDSIIGNALTSKYPTDVDSIVLTGCSSVFYYTNQTIAGLAVFAPASITDPARFGNLSPGYVQTINLDGVREVFYRAPN